MFFWKLDNFSCSTCGPSTVITVLVIIFATPLDSINADQAWVHNTQHLSLLKLRLYFSHFRQWPDWVISFFYLSQEMILYFFIINFKNKLVFEKLISSIFICTFRQCKSEFWHTWVTCLSNLLLHFSKFKLCQCSIRLQSKNSLKCFKHHFSSAYLSIYKI